MKVEHKLVADLAGEQLPPTQSDIISETHDPKAIQQSSQAGNIKTDLSLKCLKCVSEILKLWCCNTSDDKKFHSWFH